MMNQLPFNIYDGFFVSYSIKQISKEFDLLRFSSDLVINIELKSELPTDTSKRMKKIGKQMKENHYYLTSVSRRVVIYTYVDSDGLYKYNFTNQKAEKVDFSELISQLVSQPVDYEINPDKLFVPSNYLISPFNNTKRFIADEYFLNGTQQNIKKEILKSLNSRKNEFFCISANAGTGKTLLIYDIAKTLQTQNKVPLVIHCGKLNSGHQKLIANYRWNIISISAINNNTILTHIHQTIDCIVIDESQRIRNNQFRYIVERAKELAIPIIFSYDKKQYLKSGETKDIFEYLKVHYPEISIIKKALTNKIRTNNEMASFITNLFNIGKSNSYLDYDSVSIDYFDDLKLQNCI